VLSGNSILHVLSVGIHFRFSCRTSYYNPPQTKKEQSLIAPLTSGMGIIREWELLYRWQRRWWR